MIISDLITYFEPKDFNHKKPIPVKLQFLSSDIIVGYEMFTFSIIRGTKFLKMFDNTNLILKITFRDKEIEEGLYFMNISNNKLELGRVR